MDTTLAERMIARADQDGLPADHDLRVKAAEFEEGAIGFYSEPQTCSVQKFLGRWARARVVWCEYSGEEL